MAVPTDPNPSRGRAPVTPIVRHGFVALMVLWVFIPFALRNSVAQDAIPYLAAGHLASAHPRDVYAERNGDIYDLRPTYLHEWCKLAPTGTDCANVAVAFVSTPPVLPLAVVLTAAGDRLGALLMQVCASLMLVGGMWLLWRRLAHRTPRSAPLVLVTAILLTPMAMVPIGLGQTSPIMFLSLCIGLGDRRSRHGLGIAATWVASALLKLFPAVLVLVLVWRRRWRTLGWSALATVVLTGAALLIVPLSTWGDFVRTTLELSRTTTTNPYNGSFNALLVRLLPGSQAHGAGAALVTVLCLGAGAAICRSGMRGVDDDIRWAVGYLALLYVTPLVWWHYMWVAVGALAVVLAGQRRLTDRLVAVLPAVALVSAVLSIPYGRGWSMPVAQASFLIVVTFVVLALTRRARLVGAPSLQPASPQP